MPYPRRTPHIHVKLRHASFGEWASPLFLAGYARDFLWCNVPADARSVLKMRQARAPASAKAATSSPSEGPQLMWAVCHKLVVPA